MHCFELRTANVDYFVGQEGSPGGAGAESGVGLQLAKSWEAAVRQALMPVQTPASELSTVI